MNTTQPWPSLLTRGHPLGLACHHNFFSVNPEANPVAGEVRLGLSAFDLTALFLSPLALTKDPIVVGMVILLAAVAILTHLQVRAVVTIDQGMVRLTWESLLRKPATYEEPLANYAGLRHRLVRTSGRGLEDIVSQDRHALELVHRIDPGRSVIVFWSVDFEDVAPWQARLATSLGVDALEVATGGTRPVPERTLHTTLAQKVEAGDIDPSPPTAWEEPPEGVGTLLGPDRILVTLPVGRTDISVRGVRIAIAILALPLLFGAAVLPAGVSIGIVAIILAYYLRFRLNYLGDAPPDQFQSATRLVLSHTGIEISRPGVLWRKRFTVRWADVMAVDIGPHPTSRAETLIIRTSKDVFVAGEGMPRASLEWIRDFMAAAAVTA